MTLSVLFVRICLPDYVQNTSMIHHGNLLGIYHAMRAGNIAHYLAACAWRLNHRHDLKQAFTAGVNGIKTTQSLILKSVRHVLCT